MNRLKELIQYGDSEPLEIILSILMVGQLCYPSPGFFCWHSIIPDYYFVAGAFCSVGMLVGNFIGNLSLRKWSANVCLVLVLGIATISLYRGIDNVQIYLVFLAESLALFWITWRCSREEVLRLLQTSKETIKTDD